MMYCEMLDAYVQVGDFVTVSQPTGTNVVGRLIDVSGLDDVCVNKLSVENKNYFFLDVFLLFYMINALNV